MIPARNRPFPSSKKFHFQNEAKCETFVVEMSFICIIIKTHFHNKGFALSLVLKVKLFGTRKWPVKTNDLPLTIFCFVSFWVDYFSGKICDFKKFFVQTDL